MRFEVEFEREDDGRWIAEATDLSGVLAYGATRREARAKVVALHKKLLKNKRRKELLEKWSGMRAMTDNCGLEATQELDAVRRLVAWGIRLSLLLFLAYFWVRVAWVVFSFSYASTGERGAFYLICCTLVYLGSAAVIDRADVLSSRETSGLSMPRANFTSRLSCTLALGILSVFLAFYLGDTWQALQVLPLQILLLVCSVGSLLMLLQFIFETTQRKLKTGSIWPPDGMCCSSLKGKPPAQQSSLIRRRLFVVGLSLNAMIWTWLVIFHCYHRHSSLNQSGWLMFALWWIVSIDWLGAVASIVSVIRSSIHEQRESQPLPSC
jgi:predicted RNase H-like HicB family nuclease